MYLFAKHSKCYALDVFLRNHALQIDVYLITY